MALDFPIVIAAHGRSNARVLQAERSGRIPYATARLYCWQHTFRLSQITPAGATSQAIDLNAIARVAFPPRVRRELAIIKPLTAFAGGNVSAITAELGDTDDPNGLVTAIDVFTGSSLLGVETDTSGAAQYAPRIEAAFAPLLTLRTTNDNVSALTTGTLAVEIYFRRLLDLR